MGSSLSLQSKEKRRRSNRLSKPPQIQANSDCSDLCLPRQASEQALSLPSTPTTWQDPWTGGSIPGSPKEVVSQNPRSQPFSVRPLRRETTWRSDGLWHPISQRRVHRTPDTWPHSPTPTPVSSRRDSMYGRTPFHPSETATFQPTTLQSNPHSPLIGQPKRSYSVHSSSQRARHSVQRRTINRFASLNSHSRVNNHESLPIRRRSLLIRPGVATRKTTKVISPTLLSGSDQGQTASLGSHYTSFDPGSHPYMPRTSFIVDGSEPQPRLRPPTPSNFEYTHLGALKLGTLRVVNGSASPCPSDRTRLDQPGSANPQAIPENVTSAGLPSPVANGVHTPRPKSPDSLNLYTKYYPILGGEDRPATTYLVLEPR
ncbi:uncharacterized protein BDV17DRAFT_34178 [Aspergillus undulatus]|uniref:uncharacterized protein n=1 Tax=Aspergillus undulatus TaxID=1810928 RepID=UPI003CCCB95B